MTLIHMTYTGSCRFGSAGKVFLCSNMSASLDQKLLFFDHVQGLRDKMAPSATIASNVAGTKKWESTTTTNNVQKRTFRYSPAIARASFSGPIPVENFDLILDAAITGDDVEVTMSFWQKNGHTVKVSKAKIERLSIDLKAGEVATFSVDIVGAAYETSTANSSSSDCQKLLTWDRCVVDATPVITSSVSSFQMTINNPTIPIYTTKWSSPDDESGGMMPQKIRVGMQEVSGSISIYAADHIGVPSTGSVTVGLNDIQKTIKVAYVQPKDEASGGPYVRTIMFTGVDDGNIWG